MGCREDLAAGNACRWFGAGGIMRIPTRLRISWQDDNTLKVETDAGQQVRLFRFGAAPTPAGDPGWQGHSVANWEMVAGGEGGRSRWGTLRVVTRGMRAGYLRRNGVPYSENAVITEDHDRHMGPGAMEWFTVTTIVNDPETSTRSSSRAPTSGKSRTGPNGIRRRARTPRTGRKAEGNVMRVFGSVLFAAAAALLLPAVAYGQGSISGIVRDTSGAILPA